MGFWSSLFGGGANKEIRKKLVMCSTLELKMGAGARKSGGNIPSIHHGPGVDAQLSGEETERVLSDASLEDLEWACEVREKFDEADELAQSGSYRSAITKFEMAIKEAPFDALAMMTLGVCHAELGDGPKAVRVLKQAVKIDPTNARIRGNLEAIRQAFDL